MRFKDYISVPSSILMLVVLLCLLTLPVTVQAWTSVGPWGGVIHDLEKAAGGNTLFAGTGNGLYMYNMASGSETWTSFENTFGYRVLQVLPGLDEGQVFAIARSTEAPFDFEETSLWGYLYELDLDTGSFGQIFGEDDPATTATDETLQVSSMALCGASGDLIVTTDDEVFHDPPDEYPIGYVYRKPYGSSVFTEPIDPGWYYLPLPITAALGQAGSSTLYLYRSFDIFNDIVMSNDCGVSWQPDVGTPNNVTAYNAMAGSFAPTAFGYSSSGDVLFGTDNGKVYRRIDTRNWESTGSGLPSYSVADLDQDIQGRTVAVLREHYWNLSNGDDDEGGAWYLDSGTWQQSTIYNDVSSKVGKVLVYGSDDWVAYDQAGIWRYPLGATPAEEKDAGIAAVDLNGMVIDPRRDGRALAYGASGLYEMKNNIWSRIIMSQVLSVRNNDDDISDVRQSVRDIGFISGAVSHNNENTIWVGAEAPGGLLRGQRVGSGPTGYDFDQVYWGYNTRSTITDIMVDPFDSKSVWFTNWSANGIFLSADEGDSFVSMTAHITPKQYFGANVLITDLDEPQQRTILAGIDTMDSTVPGIFFSDRGEDLTMTDLFQGQAMGGLAFNPMDINRALAGPQNSITSMAIVNTNGTWGVDSTVGAPVNLPGSPIVRALQIPSGIDGDSRPDAFAVFNQNGTDFAGLYYSEANTDGGTPGEIWSHITGEFDSFHPTSVTVDPKDGNLLWVTTRTGSAFTHFGGHFQDAIGPGFPLTLGDELIVLSASASSIELFWLAPGDDGEMPGWADRYELYYRVDNAIMDTGDLDGAYKVDILSPNISRHEENYSLDISSHSGSEWYSLALIAYDEQGQSSGNFLTADVYLTEIALNSPPVAANDSTSLFEDTTVNINVLSNDSDPDTGDSVRVITVSSPLNGQSYMGSDGSVYYTPRRDYFGGDSFSYTIVDGNGGSDSAVVTLTISSINDPPEARDDIKTIPEGSSSSLDVLNNDSDVEGLISVTGATDPIYGAASISVQDTWSVVYSYDPPDSNWYGVDSFTYTIEDTDGAQDTATVTFTVSSVNDPPVALPDFIFVTEGGSATALTSGNTSVLDNDTDPDWEVTSALTAQVVSYPDYGALQVNPDGTFLYIHNGTETTSDSFTYRVKDNDKFSDVVYSGDTIVNITIDAVNDPPDAADDEVYVLAETVSVLRTLLANDMDNDPGDTLTIEAVSSAQNGSVALSTDGFVRYDSQSSSGSYSTDSFTYTLGDGLTTDMATVTVTILDVDSAVAIDDEVQVDEDTPVDIDVTLNDARLSEDDPLDVLSVTQGLHGTATADTTNDTVYYAPESGYHGTDTFTYTMTDGYSGTSSAFVRIEVKQINDPPVAGDVTATVFTGRSLAVLLPVTDIDSEILTVSAPSASSPWRSVNIALIGEGYELTYESAAGFMGTEIIEYEVEDDLGAKDTGILEIGVYNTESGMSVQVRPALLEPSGDPVMEDDAIKLSEAMVEFVEVTSNGNTRCDVGPLVFPAPSGYRAGGTAWYYDISSDATFTGTVQIFIDLTRVYSSFVDPDKVVVFKYDQSTTDWELLGSFPQGMEVGALSDTLGMFAVFEPVPASSSGGGGGGGGCFIATATYGSAMEPEVDLLREYRDSYLVNRWWGRALLKSYYALSPKPAAFIAEHPVLRQGARIVLTPIITSVKAGGDTNLPAMMGLLIVGGSGATVCFVLFGLAGLVRKRVFIYLNLFEKNREA